MLCRGMPSARKLKHAAIAAIVIDALTPAKGESQGAALLAEIDENFIRVELSPAERAAHLVERKALYEKLHPGTKRGAGGGRAKAGKVPTAKMAVSFVEAEAKRSRRSQRSIRRDVGEAEKIGGEMLAKIAGTPLDKPGEIAALAAMDEQERQEIVDRGVAGEKVSAAKTRRRPRSARDYDPEDPNAEVLEPGVTPEVIRDRTFTRQVGEALRFARENSLAPIGSKSASRAAKSEITKTHVKAAREVARAWERLAKRLERLIG
jgi:hypothetical protein